MGKIRANKEISDTRSASYLMFAINTDLDGLFVYGMFGIY
jgi:hypothetical protein